MTTSLPQVIHLLANSLRVPEASIAGTTVLADLGADSLTIIELIFDLEEEFDIQVGDERPDLVVVQDIADHVDRYLAAREATP